MIQSLPESPFQIEAPAGKPQLDVVVPFTTPRLTQEALNAANRLGENLQIRIRLVRVMVVPYPLNLHEPPVPIVFLREQLEHFESEIPADCEIRLARDGDIGLLSGLRQKSIVVLATKRQLWKTCTERLATMIRRHGFTVIVSVAEQEI